MLLPITGEATIELKTDKNKTWQRACTISARRHLCYFTGSKMHRVCNFTEDPVELLIVRFYAV